MFCSCNGNDYIFGGNFVFYLYGKSDKIVKYLNKRWYATKKKSYKIILMIHFDINNVITRGEKNRKNSSNNYLEMNLHTLKKLNLNEKNKYFF